MRYVLALSVFLTATAALAVPRVKHEFRASAERGTARRVVIDVPQSALTIRNSDTDRLELTGTVTREPDSDRSTETEQAIVNDTTVEIYVSKDEAIVQRKFGPNAQGFRGSRFSNYELTLQVPAGLDLDIRTTAGDVSIDGSFGDIDIDLRAGNIDLKMPKKDVRELNASARVGEVKTHIGGETIERQGVLPGKTRYKGSGKSIINLHVTAGDIDVELKE